MAVWLFSAVMLDNLFRNTLNMTIITMTRSRAPSDSSVNETCPSSFVSFSTESSTSKTVDFPTWSLNFQHVIIGSYFFSFVPSHIVGLLFFKLEHWKWIIGASFAMLSISSVLTPIMATASSSLLIANRLIQGTLSGLTAPLLGKIAQQWFPKHEIISFTSFIYSATSLGIALSYQLSGTLCEYGYAGRYWSLPFYFIGVVGFFWTLGWIFLVKDKPHQMSSITKEELDYIEQKHIDADRHDGEGDLANKPWFEIFHHTHFWAFFIGLFVLHWLALTLSMEIPHYFNDVLGITMQNFNGLISSLPFITIFATCLSTLLVSMCLNMAPSNIHRKVFVVIGLVLPSLSLLITTLFICHQAVSIAVLTFGFGFIGMAQHGLLANHLELDFDRAPIIYGMGNMFAAVSGIISPITTGHLVTNNQINGWRTVFIVSAIVGTLGAVFFAVFGTVNNTRRKEERQDSNTTDVVSPVTITINRV